MRRKKKPADGATTTRKWMVHAWNVALTYLTGEVPFHLSDKFSDEDIEQLAIIEWEAQIDPDETPEGYGYHWDEVPEDVRLSCKKAIKAVLIELDNRGKLK